MAFYKEYGEAHNRAAVMANLLKREVGLERFDNPIDGKGFRVFSLPKPENRCGFELRCETVKPGTPLNPKFPPHPI